MEENDITITECFKCGARYENYFNASPCCRSLMMKVDEKGNRTNITFLKSLSLPQWDYVKIGDTENQKTEMSYYFYKQEIER